MAESKYLEFSPLTFESMEKWAVNSDVMFSDQDEDLLLAAEKENSTLLFMFLQKDATLPSKKDLILTALGVLISGPIEFPDLYVPDGRQMVDEIRRSLNNNKKLVVERLTDENNEIPRGYMTKLYWAMGEPLPEPLAADEFLVDRYYRGFEQKYLSLTD